MEELADEEIFATVAFEGMEQLKLDSLDKTSKPTVHADDQSEASFASFFDKSFAAARKPPPPKKRDSSPKKLDSAISVPATINTATTDNTASLSGVTPPLGTEQLQNAVVEMSQEEFDALLLQRAQRHQPPAAPTAAVAFAADLLAGPSPQVEDLAGAVSDSAGRVA
jgi:hypothetical protein